MKRLSLSFLLITSSFSAQAAEPVPGGDELHFNHIAALPEGIIAQNGLRKILKNKQNQFEYYESLRKSAKFKKTTLANIPIGEMYHWDQLKQMIAQKEAELSKNDPLNQGATQ